MEKNADISRVLEFQELLIAFRNVPRKVLIPGTENWENDAEHTFFTTMLSWYLAQKVEPSLDRDKVIRYALLHDLVEVHAGDTFAFDNKHRESKEQREAAALKKLEADWPDFPELTQTIQQYETLSDRESKFVYAIDKMMPAIISCLDEGKVWKDEQITYEEVYAYDSVRVAKSEELTEVFEQLHLHLRAHPEYFHK